MGTSSPVATVSPGRGTGALESTESSLPDRMPLDRIGARDLRGFGANPAASISPRAGNGALKTSQPSPLDKVGVRCERAFETNLAITPGSLGATLEGRPPTAWGLYLSSGTCSAISLEFNSPICRSPLSASH